MTNEVCTNDFFRAAKFLTNISGESKWQPLNGNGRMVWKSAKTDGQKQSETDSPKSAKMSEKVQKRSKTSENRWKSVEFFRGAPEGAITLLHFSKCSRLFIQSIKSTLSYLKSCNPVGGTLSSTAWKFLTKNTRKISPMFWAFMLSWVQNIPVKFPPKFPPNFPTKTKKNSPTSFCRGAFVHSRLMVSRLTPAQGEQNLSRTAWHAPGRTCSDWFLWLGCQSGRRNGQRIERDFEQSFWAFSFFICCAERPTEISPQTPPNSSLHSRAAKRGGFKRGVSRSGLVLPFPTILGLFRFVWGLSGDFPDWSFSSFSAYWQHLRGTVPKGSATQSGPVPKKVGNPPAYLLSINMLHAKGVVLYERTCFCLLSTF